MEKRVDYLNKQIESIDIVKMPTIIGMPVYKDYNPAIPK
jgi:hypothetical protein